MKKRNLKLLSTILSLSVFATTLSPITVKASDVKTNIMIDSNAKDNHTK